MSLYPQKRAEEGALVFYSKDRVLYDPLATDEERELLIGKPNLIHSDVEKTIAHIVYLLFTAPHHSSHAHPRTNPGLPPDKRGTRHRNFYIYWLNQFRHWWKTSRLLVRISGGIVYCQDRVNRETLAYWDVTIHKELLKAAKDEKHIGQGGPIKPFLDEVQSFTRTIRLVLAVARAWEAKVDNRLYEVGIAEAFAFMGNRCARFWTRQIVDWLTVHVALPLSGMFVAPFLDQNSRPIIITMGFLRAILPFAASFQGSRFGRQVTFNTYKYAAYRWKSIQSIMKFHETTGTYQDTNLDPELLALARQVAVAIGHGTDPEETRRSLKVLGFEVFGGGSGGYSVFRLTFKDRIILLNVTPYGPSILDEMPRYILLERRHRFYKEKITDVAKATFLDAATPRNAKVKGFTYSGAFFQSQEWAALTLRHERELSNYAIACKIMRTKRLPANKRNPQETRWPSPPVDLVSLKTFTRSARQGRKAYFDKVRWGQINRQIEAMAARVRKYQREKQAPSRVILYLEGLDCSGKSSTGMLICDALERCGYDVKMAQHNRPPTAEQRAKPWMDRIRFEYPDDMYEAGEDVPDFAALVWDRGPAGDFVYGPMGDLSPEEKLKKYSEFATYDARCREEGVLFLKCFFVTDKDSIAATLGKRLAHKQIAKDLRTWLDANSVAQVHEGIEGIEMHIDPTDFVAFNKWEENLHNFSAFVRNTDTFGFVSVQQEASIGYENPWLVINTADRHSARLGLMKAFCKQLDRFANSGYTKKVPSCCGGKEAMAITSEREAVPSDIVERAENGVSFRAVFQSFVLALLFYAYAYQTWNFRMSNIT